MVCGAMGASCDPWEVGEGMIHKGDGGRQSVGEWGGSRGQVRCEQGCRGLGGSGGNKGIHNSVKRIAEEEPRAIFTLLFLSANHPSCLSPHQYFLAWCW